MIKGKLRHKTAGGERDASVGPGGWESFDGELAATLNRTFPVGDRADGVGWVIAFHEAVDFLAATVVDKPVPDSDPPGTIH